jgi:hypothetical protein
MKRQFLLFLICLIGIPVVAQDALREVCFFFLYDVSKSAQPSVAPPDTAELHKLINHYGRKGHIRFGGLYIQPHSDKQALQIGKWHHLQQNPVSGNWVKKSKIRNINKTNGQQFQAGIKYELQGCQRFFARPQTEMLTDISTAVLYFKRFAEQPNNKDIDFHLIILSDMEQDRKDRRKMAPIGLPPHVKVWLIGAPIGHKFNNLFPETPAVELVDFKAEYFTTKKPRHDYPTKR